MERGGSTPELPTDIHDISVAIWETKVRISQNPQEWGLYMRLYNLRGASRAVQLETLDRKIEGGIGHFSPRKLTRLRREADFLRERTRYWKPARVS